MSQICNNCGQPMPDGVKYCPHCGTPTPLAPITDDEADNSAKAQPTSSTPPPPPMPPLSEVKSGSQPAAPSQHGGRRFGLAAAIAGASVAIILLLCALWYIRSNTRVTVVKRVSTQSIPVDSLGQADVDSIFQVMMQQSDKQMAMMDSMEREFLYGADAMPQEEEAGSAESTRAQKQPGLLNMGGRIGAQECVLHLNINDPQNVKGSARFVTKGKQGVPMKLIGIMNGDGSLTVSMYKGEDIAGTLIGSCNGQSFEGNFTTSGNKQIPFSFARMR